jgi:F-type H+-transporting ATPase subunit delta
MIPSAIASHYSKGLFSIAKSKEELESRLAALKWLSELIGERPELKHFFSHPFVKKEEKKNVLKSLLKNGKDAVLLHFLFLLIDKNRFKNLPEILNKYRQLVNESLGLINVTSITAVTIDEELKHRIKSAIEKAYHKNIRFEEKVDPQILGGIVLLMDHQMLDDSLKGHLNKLKENLLAANV